MKYNDKQLEAVTLPVNQSAFVLSGAGSGKTRILTGRIVHLLQEYDIAPENIMAVTFTNKAANEMRQRIMASIGDKEFDMKKMVIGTFHAICYRILRDNHQKAGLNKEFEIYAPDRTKQIMRTVVKRIKADPNHTYFYSVDEKDISDYLKQINKVKEQPVGVGKPSGGLNKYLFEEYQKQCDLIGAVDFAELMYRCIKLFQEHPDVRYYYAAKYSHILVDEYQDTNAQQVQWLKLLLERHDKQHNTLFAVGDDDQSIYGFRGASSDNVSALVGDESIKLIKMEQNYRSTPNILDTANSIIAENVERVGKNLWTQTGKGNDVRYHGFDTDKDEAVALANAIKEIEQDCEEQRQSATVAVLYRTHPQSRVLEGELRKAGIRFNMYGGVSFFERVEVKKMLFWIRSLLNPDNDEFMREIINFPNRGIGDVTLGRLEDMAMQHKESLYNCLHRAVISEIDRDNALSDFIVLYDEILKNAKGLYKHELPSFLMKYLDLKTYFMQKTRDEEEYMSRMGNIQELARSIHEYFQDKPDASMIDYLDDMSLGMLQKDEDVEDNDSFLTVNLMTIHASKGLEFDHVFVVNFQDGYLPHQYALQSESRRQVEEERRLAYVAVTRARQGLTISWSGHPSRFLKNILPVRLKKMYDIR